MEPAPNHLNPHVRPLRSTEWEPAVECCGNGFRIMRKRFEWCERLECWDDEIEPSADRTIYPSRAAAWAIINGRVA